MDKRKRPGIQDCSSFSCLCCCCMEKLRTPLSFRLIIGGIMDQEIRIMGNIPDLHVHRPGVTGIDDLAPGTGGAHDLCRENFPYVITASGPDAFPALEPAKERAGLDTKSNGLFPVEPARARVFFQNIAK